MVEQPSVPGAEAGRATPPAGRVQRRRERHRSRMLDVAEQLFSHTPYGSVRIEDIAEAADVSVGTVYTHFENKDGLFLAVAERALDRAAERVAAAVIGSTDPLGRLTATGRAYLELLIDHPTLARFLVSPMSLPSEPQIRERIRSRVQQLYDALAAELDAGIRAGLLRHVDSHQMATFLIGAWCGVLTLAANPATPDLKPDQARSTVDQASGVLLQGLLAHPWVEG